MHTTRAEIDSAVETLLLPKSAFQAIADAEAAAVFQQALANFVRGGDRRWWWEAFTGESAFVRVSDAWKLLAQVVPNADEHVWFIAEDDTLPHYPVFDATPMAIEQVIGNCFGFEYYLVAKDMTWLLCENHHDYLIAVGEPVVARLLRLSP